MDEQKAKALAEALPALAAFKKVFGRDASPAFVAELLAARQFQLKLHDGCNDLGSDGLDCQGRRYQIKHRAPSAR